MDYEEHKNIANSGLKVEHSSAARQTEAACETRRVGATGVKQMHATVGWLRKAVKMWLHTAAYPSLSYLVLRRTTVGGGINVQL